MHDLLDTHLYEALGEAGFARLVGAFYRRVAKDDLLGPMYEESLRASGDSMQDAEGRLRDFLVQRFGGPGRYSEARGHPRLRMRHAEFPIDQVIATRWVTLMDGAIDEAEITGEPASLLRRFFADAALFLVNS